MRRRTLGALLCAMTSLFAPSACRKTEPPAPDAAPAQTNPTGEGFVAPGVVAADDPMNADARSIPEQEAPQDAYILQVPGSAPPAAPAPPSQAAAPPSDPFEGAISSVRASAVGCFQGQPPGEYSATLSVVVSPSGRATRVDVSGASDPAVAKCLEQAATGGSYPSTPDGRKLSIDVRVKGA